MYNYELKRHQLLAYTSLEGLPIVSLVLRSISGLHIEFKLQLSQSYVVVTPLATYINFETYIPEPSNLSVQGKNQKMKHQSKGVVIKKILKFINTSLIIQ